MVSAKAAKPYNHVLEGFFFMLHTSREQQQGDDFGQHNNLIDIGAADTIHLINHFMPHWHLYCLPITKPGQESMQ